jgi:hypothetical protein
MSGGNLSTTTLVPGGNTSYGPILTTTLSPTPGGNTTKLTTTPMTNVTPIIDNSTGVPLIFLQTPAAQGIAGTFAFAAIIITVHQVGGKFVFMMIFFLFSVQWNWIGTVS